MNRLRLYGLGTLWLALVIFGLWRLQLDVQVLNLLPSEVPSVKALKLYEDHFENANELVISLQGLEPAALEEAARELAMALRSHTNVVAEAVWTPPWLEHPGQMAEFSAYLWLNQDPHEVEALVARLAPANLAAVLEETRQQLTISLSPNEIAQLSYDPFGLLKIPGQENSSAGFGNGNELFASEDGTFRILFVNARERLGSYDGNQLWLESIREIITRWQEASPEYSNLIFGFTGRPAFVSEISSGMEWDIGTSVGGTLVIIAALFWWMHRRWKPLLWLIALLLVILVTTLALGGIIFRSLNVISIGFAAILLGLSVDYGLILYQEWLSARNGSKADLRRAVAPSVIWAACSTAGAFVFLNLGGLPGLAQLGTLVSLGIAISASVMLGLYLAPFKSRIHPPTDKQPEAFSSLQASQGLWALTALLLIGGAWVLLSAPPRMDVSSEPLRPAHSPAYTAVEEIKKRMDRPEEPLWVVGTADSFDDLAERFERSTEILARAKTSGHIARANLPVDLIPRPSRQAQNTSTLRELTEREKEFAEAALNAGFTEDALGLLETMFRVWRTAASAELPYLPREQAGHWILERFLSLEPGTCFAIGMVHPSSTTMVPEVRAPLAKELAQTGVILTGWELLGSKIYEVIHRNFALIFGLMAALVLVCLAFAFRRLVPVLLSLASVLVSAMSLLLSMWLLDWEWNLMNLMAIPLLVGAGLDYSIHVQLALDRHGGNIPEMRASVGRALFLCAASTATGFGSLAWAGNPGLGSLGRVCACGIALSYLVAVWFLPAWRAILVEKRK